MANRVPLIVDSTTLNIKELPSGDNLDLSNSGIHNAGVITATKFVGDIEGNIVGSASSITVADESTDTSCNVVFVTAATGQLPPKTSSGLTYDSANNNVTIGGSLTVANNISIGGTIQYQDVTNVDAIGIITARAGINISATTQSTSTTTGALKVAGGACIVKNLHVGGTSTFTGAIDANGALDVDGQTDLDVLNVADVATFTADVTFDGSTAGRDIIYDRSADNLIFNDNAKAAFGTGSDLQIYYTGSAGWIYQTEAGNDVTLGSNGGEVWLRTGSSANKDAVKCTSDGSVDLYFNNAKTFETKYLGAKVTGGLEVTGVTTCGGNIDANGNLDVDGQTDLDVLNVAETATFSADVQFTGDANNAFWDKSVNSLQFSDNAKATWGDHAGSGDLQIYHSAGADSVIHHTATSGSALRLRSRGFTFKNQANSATIATFNEGDACTLFNNGQARVTTTSDGTDIGGTGSLKVPVGTTAQRNSSPTDGDFRYNSTEDEFEGYSNGAWGAIGGGASETDTSVSTTNATAVYTVAHASYRSASLIMQITQGSAYQSGRYMVIHDGTTATIVEESAVATGSMLGTFTAGIDGSNLKVYVNMTSASSATVTVIPTPVTV